MTKPFFSFVYITLVVLFLQVLFNSETCKANKSAHKADKSAHKADKSAHKADKSAHEDISKEDVLNEFILLNSLKNVITVEKKHKLYRKFSNTLKDAAIVSLLIILTLSVVNNNKLKKKAKLERFRGNIFRDAFNKLNYQLKNGSLYPTSSNG